MGNLLYNLEIWRNSYSIFGSAGRYHSVRRWSWNSARNRWSFQLVEATWKQHIWNGLIKENASPLVAHLLVTIKGSSSLKMKNWHQRKMNGEQLSPPYTMGLLDVLYSIIFQAHEVNSDYALYLKVEELFWMSQMTDPPLLCLESETYQVHFKLLESVTNCRAILNSSTRKILKNNTIYIYVYTWATLK